MKKLQLNKQIIARLDNPEKIYGGGGTVNLCNTVTGIKDIACQLTCVNTCW